MTLKQFHSYLKPKSKPKPGVSFKPDQFPILVHWATTETFCLNTREVKVQSEADMLLLMAVTSF